MSGHVFHPGHEALHGVTVLVTCVDGRRYVGRYHETTPRGVLLHDVAAFEQSGGMAFEEWIGRQWKFGVHVAHKHVVVPTDEIRELARFSELIDR